MSTVVVREAGGTIVTPEVATGLPTTSVVGVAARGPQGPVGVTGATGPTGATGATGPTGPQGPAGGGTNWLGAWDSGTAYVADDAISYAGSSYICLLGNTNNVPPNPTYWALLASKGDIGTTGPAGDTGATGATGATGSTGAAGADGRTWFSGVTVPSDATGINGDFYIRTDTSAYYGPKAGGTWTGTGPISLAGPAGATGADGATGATGATGTAGLNVLNGAGAPSGGTGVDGEFYINTSANTIYGPKTGGAWGSPTSLVGPTGATGAAGTAAKYGRVIPLAAKNFNL